MSNNIEISDYPKSYYLYLKRYFNAFLRYRRTYKNYFQVLRKVRANEFPVKGILRNGKVLTINSKVEAATTAYGLGNFIVENDLLVINKADLPIIKLCGWENNADLYEIFFLNSYGFLPVKNNHVIDIGANIADSSIYFALRGATKVIAIELVPKNFEFAKKNVELNHLTDKITLILGGCSNKKTSIQFDPAKSGMGHSIKSADKNGITVPLMTLDEIIQQSDADSPILKMDCEGCEYETILSSSKETLQKFGYIFIEYHFGYKNLKEKLEKSGFEVSFSSPSYYRHPYLKQQKSFIGYLYAKRKSNI